MCLASCRYVVLRFDAQLAQRARDVTQRQAHHVGETVIELIGRMKAGVLNGIRARFIERIAAGDVVVDLLIGVGPHPNVTRREIGDPIASDVLDDQSSGDGRMHLMNSIAQAHQHRSGLGGIDRFAQRFAIERDSGV